MAGPSAVPSRHRSAARGGGRWQSLWLVTVPAVFAGLRSAGACTVLAAGKLATSDGSVLVTHSDDGENNPDARLCYIPAVDPPVGASRPIYWDTEGYPRQSGTQRGPCYEPVPGQPDSVPIGFIPNEEHLFAYFEATYGIVNEHGLAIGESTCSGVFGTNAVGHGGKALLSIDSLSRIAMERAMLAKDAVKLMGSLAEKYGFYGAGSFEGTAETLLVGDPGEAWIFHILPDPTGTSAIWAAQRVPDDHVAVVANMFIIRNIDFQDPQNFLYSESVRSVAQAKGWWKPGDPLDFTAVYSDGEYAHKFYSGRRLWGAYRRFGIDILPENYTDLRHDAVYPVTAKPARQVGVRDMFGIHRDFYQGTKYDMTTGLAAGPWGDPDRFSLSPDQRGVVGSWERSIGLYRTAVTHVVQTKATGQGAVLWFGPHATATSCFVPLAARALAVPAPYSIADPTHLSRDSAYWAHKYVANIVRMKYTFAMKQVALAQDTLEAEGIALVAQIDAAKPSAEAMTAAYVEHAVKVVASFWALPDTIIEAYADGWTDDGNPLGYPEWWLKAVGYQNGPPPPPPQPSPAPSPLSPEKCSDDAVRGCVGACPAAGFASCAAGCFAGCGGFGLPAQSATRARASENDLVV